MYTHGNDIASATFIETSERAFYGSGHTTEHSFRPALAKLFCSINPAISSHRTSEPDSGRIFCDRQSMAA